MVLPALRNGEPDQRTQARLRAGEAADAALSGQLGVAAHWAVGVEHRGVVQAVVPAAALPHADCQDVAPSGVEGGG